jgi:hypothetical protein
MNDDLDDIIGGDKPWADEPKLPPLTIAEKLSFLDYWEENVDDEDEYRSRGTLDWWYGELQHIRERLLKEEGCDAEDEQAYGNRSREELDAIRGTLTARLRETKERQDRLRYLLKECEAAAERLALGGLSFSDKYGLLQALDYQAWNEWHLSGALGAWWAAQLNAILKLVNEEREAWEASSTPCDEVSSSSPSKPTR